MNVNMWQNPITQANVARLRQLLREAKRQGCRVLLVTSASLRDAEWPREALDDILYMQDDKKRWKLEDLIHGTAHLARRTSIDRIVREQAFTVLNRLAALRMAEARGLLIPSIAEGVRSDGFQLSQPYPNPFTDATVFEVRAPAEPLVQRVAWQEPAPEASGAVPAAVRFRGEIGATDPYLDKTGSRVLQPDCEEVNRRACRRDKVVMPPLRGG